MSCCYLGLTQKEKEDIVASALYTEEGRRELAKVMSGGNVEHITVQDLIVSGIQHSFENMREEF